MNFINSLKSAFTPNTQFTYLISVIAEFSRIGNSVEEALRNGTYKMLALIKELDVRIGLGKELLCEFSATLQVIPSHLLACKLTGTLLEDEINRHVTLIDLHLGLASCQRGTVSQRLYIFESRSLIVSGA